MYAMKANGLEQDAQITAQQVAQSDALVNEVTSRMASNLTASQRRRFLRNSSDLRTHNICNSPEQTFNMPLYVGNFRG